MRSDAFVLPFKETTRGGRSRAIGLRRDQPLGNRVGIAMAQIYCGSVSHHNLIQTLKVD